MRDLSFSSAAHLAACLSIISRALAQLNVTANTSDPSIVYKGNWNLTEGLASHITSQTGATATFTFNGTSVAWKSTRSSRQGIERVSVDSQSWSVDTSYVDESMSAAPVVVFQVDSLQPMLHELTVTKVSTTDKVAVIWDFIYVPSNAAPLFNASTTSLISQATSSSADTSAAESTKSASSPASSGGSSNTLKIGLSAAAGALGAILIAIVVLIIWRRRRRASEDTLSVSALPESAYKHDEPTISLHTQDPAVTIMSLPSSTEPSSYTPANTAEISSPSTRLTMFSEPPSLASDGPSSALLSDGTGRREPPPSYIAPVASGQASTALSRSIRQPNDLAIFVESSSASIYGDIVPSKGKLGV